MEFESEILQKYESELLESCRKTGILLVRNNGRARETVSYDNMRWNITKIFQIITFLTSIDLISYLKEIKFIDHSKLRCLKCNGVLTLNNKQRSVDGLIYQCNGKFESKPCNGSRSVRANSWFSRSKLTMFQIMSYTYYWWKGTKLTKIQT
jgi:hypothetical protein